MRLALLAAAAACRTNDPAAAPVDAPPDAAIVRVSCTVPSVWGYDGPFCGLAELAPGDAARFASACTGQLGTRCADADLIGTCTLPPLVQFFYRGGDASTDQLNADCLGRGGTWHATP